MGTEPDITITYLWSFDEFNTAAAYVSKHSFNLFKLLRLTETVILAFVFVVMLVQFLAGNATIWGLLIGLAGGGIWLAISWFDIPWLSKRIRESVRAYHFVKSPERDKTVQLVVNGTNVVRTVDGVSSDTLGWEVMVKTIQTAEGFVLFHLHDQHSIRWFWIPNYAFESETDKESFVQLARKGSRRYVMAC